MPNEPLSATTQAAFQLRIVRGCFTAAQLLADDRLGSLLVECACWERHRSDWRSRGPRRWLVDRRRTWLAEGRALFSERVELVELARGCGMLA